MKRKFITVFAALILLPAFLFAVPVVVTWEWLLEDPLVTTFRYQVDGEKEDNWTVVDSSVTSYTERGLDGTVDHTLYLQQSYDGEHFSGSAASVAEAMFPPEEEVPVVASEPAPATEEIVAEEPAPVAEEVVAEEPAPVAEEVVAEEPAPVAEEVVAEEPAPVAEEVVAEEPVAAAEEVAVVAEEPAAETPLLVAEEPVEEKKKAESRSRTTLTLGGTFNFQDPALNIYHKYNLQAELGVHMENLLTFNDSLGLGVDLGLAYSPYLYSSYGWTNTAEDVLAFDFSTALSNFDQAGTISIAPMLNISMGKTDFDIGIGGFLTWGPDLATTSGDAFLYGAFAKAALEYHFNKTFSLGASAKYGLILSEGTSSMPQFAEGTVYMGFSF
ncbi:hypothetical protein DYP60_08210 [Sphaerochaeta halotolerans]|uniref:Uncharacterized protein n=1 Tax=Sphaerochaeta halotolerans TaxID=2293840 RepID=A0A372MGE2_9SPIR|nr:hypothetical protein [Sphaerochaeta halotolerans]RFU94822.1 hypothetical protein DYP60_08210 [Sphaerochaeta halotolerans]